MQVSEIKAVHQRNLKDFLAELGLLEAVQKGEVKCTICECLINETNIGTIYRLEGTLRVCCDRVECLNSVLAAIKPTD